MLSNFVCAHCKHQVRPLESIYQLYGGDALICSECGQVTVVRLDAANDASGVVKAYIQARSDNKDGIEITNRAGTVLHRIP